MRPEVTRSELAQLVRWMLDSGLYDTEDVVDAIVKPNRYEDELFAAVHGVDQESFDAAIALREAVVGDDCEVCRPSGRVLSCLAA